jgi:hypothetical protein
MPTRRVFIVVAAALVALWLPSTAFADVGSHTQPGLLAPIVSAVTAALATTTTAVSAVAQTSSQVASTVTATVVEATPSTASTPPATADPPASAPSAPASPGESGAGAELSSVLAALPRVVIQTDSLVVAISPHHTSTGSGADDGSNSSQGDAPTAQGGSRPTSPDSGSGSGSGSAITPPRSVSQSHPSAALKPSPETIAPAPTSKPETIAQPTFAGLLPISQPHLARWHRHATRPDRTASAVHSTPLVRVGAAPLASRQARRASGPSNVDLSFPIPVPGPTKSDCAPGGAGAGGGASGGSSGSRSTTASFLAPPGAETTVTNEEVDRLRSACLLSFDERPG